MSKTYDPGGTEPRSPDSLGSISDFQLLKSKFHRSFDPSLVIHFAKSRQEKFFEPLGEGTHFRSYRLRTPSQDSLVVSLAKPEFRQGLRSSQEEWRREMLLVKGLNAPLIPPMELLWVQDQLVVVMPFFPDGEERVGEEWKPLKKHVADLNKALRKAGFHINDCLQIRCLEGMPFIIDWSDLEPVGRG